MRTCAEGRGTMLRLLQRSKSKDEDSMVHDSSDTARDGGVITHWRGGARATKLDEMTECVASMVEQHSECTLDQINEEL